MRTKRRLLTLLLLGYSWITPANAAGVEDKAYFSKSNNREIKVKVYTPPGYEAGRDRYPVVYNLHGGGGSPERQWERVGATLADAMEKKLVRPMIYVFAEGLGNTLFVNTAGTKLQVETTVIKELIPFIDANYRTIPAREARAIDGFSMGGFGALHFAFKYPELFSSVVGYGAALLKWETLSERDRRENFGDSREYFDQNNPWAWAKKNAAKVGEHVRVRLVIGTEDRGYARHEEFKQYLEANKIKVDYAVAPGVEHCTKCLYEKFGLESLKFIEAAFGLPGNGFLEDREYLSKSMNRTVRFKVYTPPQYRSDAAGRERYPVVYNLHGAGGGSPDRQWDRTRAALTDAMDNRRVRPMIYVFVDGLGSTFFVDSFDGTRKAETTFIRELIPHVDAHWRTIASKKGRAVDGFSMGGCGALMLSFKYPELFSSVVSYGGALVTFERLKNQDYGPQLFNNDERYFDRFNPRALAEKNAGKIRRGLRVRLVIGSEDGLYKTNVDFKGLLDRLSIPYSWEVVPGVAHCTECLYNKVGLEGLKFMEAGFGAK
jgi:enterochelin esterase-like enzyme